MARGAALFGHSGCSDLIQKHRPERRFSISSNILIRSEVPIRLPPKIVDGISRVV